MGFLGRALGNNCQEVRCEEGYWTEVAQVRTQRWNFVMTAMKLCPLYQKLICIFIS
jgi:hypothetical protein